MGKKAGASMRVLAMLCLLGMVAAACGGDQGDDNGDGDGDGDGASGEDVVRIGYDLAGSSRGGFSFDPESGTSTVSDIGLYHWVYGGLMRVAGDGSLVPDLAESAEVVDPTTIEVELREGLELTDGTPVDAEMVRAVLEDNLSKADVATFADSFYSLESVEVTSPTSLMLTIPDGTAGSWFDRHMASVETALIPPDTDYDAPVGAGPYTVAEIAPEQTVVLEKNPGYWDADEIDIERVELIHLVPDSPSAPSAINAEQVDYIRLNTRAQAQSVTDAEVLSEPDPYGLVSILQCKSEAPLDDVRVRRALSYATDRDAINQALFDGEGLPAWDIWPDGHRFFNEDWNEHYAYDPDRARELLAEAGHGDGLAIDFVPYPTMTTLTEVLQAQWAEVGVELNVVPTSNFVEDAFINPKAPLTLIPVIPQESGRTGHWSGGGVSNMCGYADPELDSLVDELAQVRATSDEAVETMHAISDIVNEEVLSILVLYQPQWNAYSSRLGNVDPVPHTIVVPDLWQLTVES